MAEQSRSEAADEPAEQHGEAAETPIDWPGGALPVVDATSTTRVSRHGDPTARVDEAPDGTVRVERDRTVAVRRAKQPITAAPADAPRFTVTAPIIPPVTDHRRLDFSLPEVLSGQIARYAPRIGMPARDLPAFDPDYELPARVEAVERRRDASAVISAEQLHARSWHRRAVLTVTIVTVAVLAVAAAGFWALSLL